MTFIDAQRDRFGVEPICRTLGLAPSTYSARRTRPLSRRAVQDARLLERIRTVHERNYGASGSRRVWKALDRTAACARVVTASFSRTWWTWFFTVACSMTKCDAVCWFTMSATREKRVISWPETRYAAV